jgi:hypothetical protein
MIDQHWGSAANGKSARVGRWRVVKSTANLRKHKTKLTINFSFIAEVQIGCRIALQASYLLAD